MRLLVLGGTRFLSRAVAADAVGRGHEVTCAARGASGDAPAGAELVRLDRTAPDWQPLRGPWDAVVDVASVPSWVDAALDALAEQAGHWTFVSTINVYADEATPGGTPATLPLREPAHDDGREDEPSPELYGAHKVACEQAVRARAGQALVIRPGLIVGPGDPSGRYSWWPERLADGGQVLAPAPAERSVQVIDVRDLARWIVDCAERGTTGVFDGIGPARPIAAFIEQTARGVGADVEPVWVPQEFLAEQQVEPWMGPRSLPLYLPLPEYAGLAAHDATPSLAAGLRIRPLEETAAATLTWLRDNPDAERTGLTREEEQDVLAAWHSLPR
jgi:2'-hydroxyisoflavone reductase